VEPALAARRLVGRRRAEVDVASGNELEDRGAGVSLQHLDRPHIGLVPGEFGQKRRHGTAFDGVLGIGAELLGDRAQEHVHGIHGAGRMLVQRIDHGLGSRPRRRHDLIAGLPGRRDRKGEQDARGERNPQHHQDLG
jgi:hypothetical protein